MSAGYAERLSEYPNKGKCGLPESFDTPRALSSKLDALAKLMRQSSHTVVLTGAGCSTSAGIPDFRGPNGIWTREMKTRRNKNKQQQGSKIMSKKRKSDEAVEDVDASEGTSWVQCDICSKWRRIPASNTHQLPDKWTCVMNTTDPKHSRCTDPEEDYNRGCTIKSGGTSQPEPKKRDRQFTDSGTTNTNDKTGPNTSSKPGIPSFESAIPTYTHRALTHLILQAPPRTDDDESNSDNTDKPSPPRMYLNHIVTQNIDGLHRKSRLPRKHLSILHGDIFTEVCDTCRTEHVRPYEITSIGLSYTGRNCTLGGDPPGSCGGKLMDTLLDWENDLPEEDWQRAQEECEKADLILCLGTSLRIEPAGGLCLFAKETEKKKHRRKLGYVIVNLQVTPYDDGANLIIRGKVDEVMEGLMARLGYHRDWDD